MVEFCSKHQSWHTRIGRDINSEDASTSYFGWISCVSIFHRPRQEVPFFHSIFPDVTDMVVAQAIITITILEAFIDSFSPLPTYSYPA